MKERPRPADTPQPAGPSSRADDEAATAPEPPEPSTDGPSSLDWWLKDGPDSPIAADIAEPEKHL
jgi:hypothetical protein